MKLAHMAPFNWCGLRVVSHKTSKLTSKSEGFNSSDEAMQWVNSLKMVELPCDGCRARMMKFRNFRTAKLEFISFLKCLTPRCYLDTKGDTSIVTSWNFHVPNGEKYQDGIHWGK